MSYVTARQNDSKVLDVARLVLQKDPISKHCAVLSIGSEGSAEQLLVATSAHQISEQLMKAIFDMYKTVWVVLQGLHFSESCSV